MSSQVSKPQSVEPSDRYQVREGAWQPIVHVPQVPWYIERSATMPGAEASTLMLKSLTPTSSTACTVTRECAPMSCSRAVEVPSGNR